MTIGEKLVALREGRSQKEVAEALGIRDCQHLFHDL